MDVNNFMLAICSGSDNKELFLTSNEISCDSLSIEFNPINELFDTSKTGTRAIPIQSNTSKAAELCMRQL
jgi:hypothetical protein